MLLFIGCEAFCTWSLPCLSHSQLWDVGSGRVKNGKREEADGEKRHDWSDDYCVRILRALKPAMGKDSRILLCEQIMSTTLRAPSSVNQAPEPLPANYGAAKRFSHARDLALMTMLNGIERTPEQFRILVEKAGLKVERFWDVRSQVGLCEVRLP